MPPLARWLVLCCSRTPSNARRGERGRPGRAPRRRPRRGRGSLGRGSGGDPADPEGGRGTGRLSGAERGRGERGSTPGAGLGKAAEEGRSGRKAAERRSAAPDASARPERTGRRWRPGSQPPGSAASRCPGRRRAPAGGGGPAWKGTEARNAARGTHGGIASPPVGVGTGGAAPGLSSCFPAPAAPGWGGENLARARLQRPRRERQPVRAGQVRPFSCATPPSPCFASRDMREQAPSNQAREQPAATHPARAQHGLRSPPVNTCLFAACLCLWRGTLGHDFLGPKVLAEPAVTSNTVCMTLPWLSRRQLGLCARSPEAMASALQGIHLAIHECQHQLQERRWDCSDLGGSSTVLLNINSAVLKRGFRESAFAFSLLAAGVTHAVATSCSLGELQSCSCDSPGAENQKLKLSQLQMLGQNKGLPPAATSLWGEPGLQDTWEWGGCSADFSYAQRFARHFLDPRGKPRDAHARMQLHSHRVGRKVVSELGQRRCKCHGPSGSCQFRTCWLAAPEFQKVASNLRERMDHAVLLRPHNSNSGAFHPRLRRSRLAKHLIFYEPSPDFCEPDPSLGSPGTHGRPCTRGSSQPGGCSSLCCGRGHNVLQEMRRQRCHCRFHWCCHVQCEECPATESVSICK